MSEITSAPQSKVMIQALWRLQKIILDSLDFKDVTETVVNGLLSELGFLNLGYKIIVLTLIDEKEGVLKRISLSQTEEARRALSLSPIAFHKIEIPLSETENFLIKCIQSREPQITHRIYDVLRPILTEDEAQKSQIAAGIKTSFVYPIIVRNKVIGSLIFSMTKDESEVSDEEKELIRGFSDIVGLAVQNSQLYSQLDNLNEKLKELDKRKDEFVSVASHELRTPMTAIRSYLWLALAGKGGDLSEKQHHYIDRAYLSTIRLIKLVNDMLNISRIESGRLYLEPESVDLFKLAQDVIAEVKPRADELGINLHLTKPLADLPPVLGDVDKLKEVFINLIGNSLKFTHPNGNITVRLDGEDKMVVISIVDDGEGIEPQNIEKLFQKFGLVAGSYVTNQNAAQGTGLGLYICKSIIELLGGRIWVESKGKGLGATFSFTLKQYNEEDFENIKRSQEGKEPLGIIHSSLE